MSKPGSPIIYMWQDEDATYTAPDLQATLDRLQRNLLDLERRFVPSEDQYRGANRYHQIEILHTRIYDICGRMESEIPC